ncbi:uncharacterized protein LDX57_003463 [Aspergillus melleus]|uniref:uncharacterized protein n=1 Tax=Aspergillus melleus TaxID=138277 RepID=UPI001E8EDC3D|nr:uncharacterized protein LDX57_003463 [Aspergillus melleus]KAH8425716.1 hypothetical protein LDX57_003463 [Aspergillus melleus]
MNNAFGVAWRVPCPGLCPSNLLPSKPTSLRLLSCVSSSTRASVNVPRRPFSFSSPLPFLHRPPSPRGSIQSPFSLSLARSFANSGSLRAQSAPPREDGIKPRAEPFSQAEINAIFGPGARVSLHMGNRVLAVLHGRRLNGTPELDLPKDITSAVRGPNRDKALEWLREHYPLDEDAAILSRFEREAREEEEKLIRRAESLGLYKPQSGSFGAELGDSNDPSGRSILQETRQRNEARILAEEEERRQKWLEGEEQEREKMQQMVKRNTDLQLYEDSTALEARPRADPSQRPLLAWIQKHHLRATDWDMDISHVTTVSR